MLHEPHHIYFNIKEFSFFSIDLVMAASSNTLLKAFGDNINNNALLTLSQIAEPAERYEDMAAFISKLIINKCKLSQEITIQERNTLSAAYKHLTGSTRASLRILMDQYEDVDDGKVDTQNYEQYKEIVTSKLRTDCNNILDIVEKHIIPSVEHEQSERLVFYMKLAGDYYRYLAEWLPEQHYKDTAIKYYTNATELSNKILSEIGL